MGKSPSSNPSQDVVETLRLQNQSKGILIYPLRVTLVGLPSVPSEGPLPEVGDASDQR
jgi:hypothetical protein